MTGQGFRPVGEHDDRVCRDCGGRALGTREGPAAQGLAAGYSVTAVPMGRAMVAGPAALATSVAVTALCQLC